jgi:hypothetical protein
VISRSGDISSAQGHECSRTRRERRLIRGVLGRKPKHRIEIVQMEARDCLDVVARQGKGENSRWPCDGLVLITHVAGK